MKITARSVSTGLLSTLMAIVLMGSPTRALAQGPPSPQGYRQGFDGWDAAPNGFTRDIQQQGYRDGVDGARKDYGNHRRPNVNNRDEFRNYGGPERRVYRAAFFHGYRVGAAHYYGGPRPY